MIIIIMKIMKKINEIMIIIMKMWKMIIMNKM